MLRTLRSRATICVLTGLIMLAGGAARGNWFEAFDGGEFDLPTWQFTAYPDVTKTFKAEIIDGPNYNDYLSFTETSSVGDGGSAFGAGFAGG